MTGAPPPQTVDNYASHLIMLCQITRTDNCADRQSLINNIPTYNDYLSGQEAIHLSLENKEAKDKSS